MKAPTAQPFAVRALQSIDGRCQSLNYLVERIDGQLYDATISRPLFIVGETTLMGWGELDGPAVQIQPFEDGKPVVTWIITLPADKAARLGITKLKELALPRKTQ